MDHTRHSALFDCSRFGVTLIGLGGIGAATALCLAKMGIRNFSLYDPDIVSAENMPTQLHLIKSHGVFKVHAVKDMLALFSDELVTVETWPERITASDGLMDNMIISAVDSIAARKDIWEAVKRGKCLYYLEARMGAEQFQLNIVYHGDQKWYEDALNQDDDAFVPELPCTAKATMFTGFISAGIIGATVRKIASGEELPRKLVFDIFNNTLLEI